MIRDEKEIRDRLETLSKKRDAHTNLAMILSLQTEIDTLLWVLRELP
jgi:hypothetical protein